MQKTSKNIDFRAEIRKACANRGISIYALAQSLEKTAPNTVYRYLRSENDLTGEKIAEIFDALGIELRLSK